MKIMDKAWVPPRGPGLPWVAGEYESLRDQVRRFVEEEIKPCADRWEEDGFIPRSILRRMGELGFFGIATWLPGMSFTTEPTPSAPAGCRVSSAAK
jgi:hypothetical protein